VVVVFPASMWATIPMFRSFSMSVALFTSAFVATFAMAIFPSLWGVSRGSLSEPRGYQR